MRAVCAWMIVIALAAAGAAGAAIPRTLNYQGVLTDPSGVPLEGEYGLTFRIYTTQTGGTPLWQETDSLTVAHGVMNALLGKISPLELPFDGTYWLGITIGVGSELSPRAELTASPYAMRAAVADSVVGGGGGGGIGGSGTTNQVAKFTGTTSIGNSILCETGTNVGIGSGFTSPTCRLQIHSDEAVIRLTTPTSGSAWNDGLQIGPYTANGLGYDFWNREAGFVRIATNNTERVRVEADGNVGIGASSPAAKLHVAAGGGSANLRLQNTHVDGDSWEFQSGITGVSDHYLGIKNVDASTLAMIVRDNGNVGIGTPSGPAEKLQVAGTVHSTTGGFKFPDGTVQTTAASGGGIGGSGTAGWVPKFTGTGTTIGNSVVREAASGDIGLRTTPAATLHVHKDYDTAAIRLTDFNTGTGSTDGLEISFPGGYTDAQIWNRENGELSFGTSGIERMSIAAGGAVDITNNLSVTSSSSPALYSICTTTGNTHEIAVEGVSNPAPGYGFGGYFRSTGVGVKGDASDLITGGQMYKGVEGRAEALTGSIQGVYGYAQSVTGGTKYGVKGYVQGPGTNYAVYGSHGGGAGTYYAGYFDGNVHVTGNLTVSGSKSFKIDHPLDPGNKYLVHYCTESDEMLNVYSGNVTLDGSGEAWVELPEWFASINRDFRYQLTPIGGYAPLYVANEIAGNRFAIAGGSPNLKVSWHVTAVRSDAYAEKNAAPAEQEKKGSERGRYLHPELYGMPASMGMVEPSQDE